MQDQTADSGRICCRYFSLHTQTWSHAAIGLYQQLGFKLIDTDYQGQMNPEYEQVLTIFERRGAEGKRAVKANHLQASFCSVPLLATSEFKPVKIPLFSSIIPKEYQEGWARWHNFFKYGAMNSGKTIEILKVAHNYEEQDKPVVIMTSGIDVPGSGSEQFPVVLG